MTKIKSSANFLLLRIATIFWIIPQCLAALSDKQLCYDPNCSEPISLARTVLSYRANDREIMSFGSNADVKVFSKGAGKRTDLWGVEINGKRGFAPKSFLNEYKVLKRDLSYEVPVYKFNDEANKIESEQLESIEEENNNLHTLQDELTLDDSGTLSLKSTKENVIEKSHVINADSVLPSYEVIDGTTLYFDGNPSAQSNFVPTQATALPNKQASVVSDIDHKKSDKLEKIQSTDSQEQISSDKPIESSEAIKSSTLDTKNKDDISKLDNDNKSKEKLVDNIEHTKELDKSTDENDEKEMVTENVESEGIFASITKSLKILTNLKETTVIESTTTQINDDTAASEISSSNNVQLEKQVLENIDIKDAVTEKILSTETMLESSVDQNLDKEKIEVHDIMNENLESAKLSDEKIKETSTIILKKTTLDDVPLSNNFVHENVDKSAKKSPAILVDNDSVSTKIDVDSHIENIQQQETNEAKNIVNNVEINNSDKEKLTILSNLSENIVTQTIISQSNGNVERKLSENGVTNSEDIKKDYKEIINQVNETTKISETTNLPEMTKNIIESHLVNEIVKEALNKSIADVQLNESIVYNNVNKNNLVNNTNSDSVPIESNEVSDSIKSNDLGPEQSIDSSQEEIISKQTMIVNEDLKPNLSNNEESLEYQDIKSQIVDSADEDDVLPEYDHISNENEILNKNENEDNNIEKQEITIVPSKIDVTTDEICMNDHECESEITTESLFKKEDSEAEGDNLIDVIKLDHNYWKTLIYLSITAFTTLVFTLGYYYIENTRRDRQLIAKINKLEKELLVSTKECEVLSENLKSTKDKLHCIEDESFGSNEMVASLKADLEMSQNAKMELEEQVAMLEKDLENATEAGLELERMLREVLSSNNEVNPLAQSVEDLQARLDAQQAANESLTNALNLKTQEVETLSADVAFIKKKCEELKEEYMQKQHELLAQINLKNNIEQTLTDKVHTLEEQVAVLSAEKSSLYKELRSKEIETKELLEIINQVKSNNLDVEKLYDVSHIKTEVVQLREERDELKMRLNDVEGAHQLLEEHMKFVKEEIVALSEQCKVAEKEKKDAETRLEVLSKFFQEKETERQKEEAIWLQKQGEVVSTVERLHTMQNEIQNYKQQIEMLKHEIIDQEREYKSQISALETKAHEQWVAARQNERRLEETKAEASQLRNRLTLIEKNLNDTDSEAKLHRLEANGETATSPPLFIGAESSSSPIMFSSSSGVPPPPPPSYLSFTPYLPPLPPAAASGLPSYDISQRPPPLGGRLSSPPPMLPSHLYRPPVSGGRYENAGSPPPLMSPPHLLPPFDHHRSPPIPPFGGDHIPPLPPPGSILPPPLGASHPWGEESLPHPHNSGFHPHQREQRACKQKGSLHSSGESLDKTHYGKV